MEAITVPESHAVAAMMSALEVKANTGEQPSDHHVALSMLAAQNGGGVDHPLVSRLAASNDTTPAVGADKFDQLTALLMGSTDSPDQQVKDGQIPQPPVISVPPGYSDADAINSYASVQDAQSMCQLYASMLFVSAGKIYDITQTGDAQMGFAAQAKYAYNAMMGPMAGFYIFSSGTTSTYDNTMNKSDVHGNFLGEIFGPYGFDAATTKSLDDMLTNFTQAIPGLTAGSPGQTIDHCLRFSLCPRKDIAGDGSKIVFQPTTYIVYMKIDADSYSQSVSKHNSVDKVHFKMQYTVVKCELNVKAYEAKRDKFDKIFNMVTKKNLREFSQLLNKEPK
jgi:hypothetical protein